MSESKQEALPTIMVTVAKNPEQSDLQIVGDVGFEITPEIKYVFATGVRDVVIVVENGKSAWRFYRYIPCIVRAVPRPGDRFSYRRMGYIANYVGEECHGMPQPSTEELAEELKTIARSNARKKRPKASKRK